MDIQTACVDYTTDQFSQKTFNVTYTQYLESLVDCLMKQQYIIETRNVPDMTDMVQVDNTKNTNYRERPYNEFSFMNIIPTELQIDFESHIPEYD